MSSQPPLGITVIDIPSQAVSDVLHLGRGSREVGGPETTSPAEIVFNADDSRLLLTGRHRESVTLKKSGKAGKPITIRSYGLDQVEIRGVEPVKAKWTLHDAAKGIYALLLSPKSLDKAIVEENFQVFVDKHPLLPARWPNTRYDEILTRKGWQPGGEDACFGHFHVPELVGSDLDLEGVDIYLNIIHQFFTWKRQVTAFDSETGRLEYPQDIVIAPRFFREGSYWDRKGWSDDYFYLQGSYGLLDYPGEFHYDAAAGILYIIPRRVLYRLTRGQVR